MGQKRSIGNLELHSALVLSLGVIRLTFRLTWEGFVRVDSAILIDPILRIPLRELPTNDSFFLSKINKLRIYNSVDQGSTLPQIMSPYERTVRMRSFQRDISCHFSFIHFLRQLQCLWFYCLHILRDQFPKLNPLVSTRTI